MNRRTGSVLVLALLWSAMLTSDAVTARVSAALPTLFTQDADVPDSVRPPQVGYTGDGTGYVGGRNRSANHRFGTIHWVSWNHRVARGTGIGWLNDCRPSCADGHFKGYPAHVRADSARGGRFRHLIIGVKIHGRIHHDFRRLRHIPASEYGPGYDIWDYARR